jgi:hypothetical protein
MPSQKLQLRCRAGVIALGFGLWPPPFISFQGDRNLPAKGTPRDGVLRSAAPRPLSHRLCRSSSAGSSYYCRNRAAFATAVAAAGWLLLPPLRLRLSPPLLLLGMPPDSLDQNLFYKTASENKFRRKKSIRPFSSTRELPS